MTAREQASLLDSTATWQPVQGIKVEVRISDVRQAFGRTDCLVVPLSGTGSTWVDLDSLILDGLVQPS